MQEDQYSDQEAQRPGLGNKKYRSKNQQIYGLFYQTYESNREPTVQISSTYSNFKSGQTIQNYSAKLEVNIPKSKKKQEDNDPLALPQVGEFNLETFLKKVQHKEKLENIQEEDQEESGKQNISKRPIALNDMIKKKLQLKKIGEKSQDQQQITFEDYFYKKEKEAPKKTQQQIQKEKQFRQNYGIGAKMLLKMGFTATKGLGKNQSGILQPVQAVKKTALTVRDSQKLSKYKQQQEQQEQQSKVQQKIDNIQQIFQYKSKNKQINQFLLNLKAQYQKYQSKSYFYQKQLQSYQRQIQISKNLYLQKNNKLQNLNKIINSYQSLLINFNNCQIYPHLALQYNIDLIYVKNIYQQLCQLKLQQLFNGKMNQNLKKLRQNLSWFYIAKGKQNLKDYHQITGIQIKVNNLTNKNKQRYQQQQIINVSQSDQQKIDRYIQIIIQDTILPKLIQYLSKLQTIHKFKLSSNKKNLNYQIIQLLSILKIQSKSILQKLLKTTILPLINKYFQNINISLINLKQQQLPHLIVFPWFMILQPQQLDLSIFIKKTTSIIWSLQNDILFNLIQPWLKFLNQHQKNNLINFYIIPRLYCQLQKFKLNNNQQNKNILTALKLYSKILPKNIVDNLLKNTIILEIYHTYKFYQKQMDSKQLNLWLNRWRKQIDKISMHLFEKELKEYSIVL